MVQQVLTNGAREGARFAVLDGSTSAATKQRVQDYLTSAGVSGATVAVKNSAGAEVEPSTIGYGELVTVSAEIPFSSVSWLPTPWFLKNDTQLKAVSVMRRETVQ